MADYRLQFNELFFVVCDFGFSNFTADSNRHIVAGMKKPTSAGLTTRYAAPEVSIITDESTRRNEFISCFKKSELPIVDLTHNWTRRLMYLPME